MLWPQVLITDRAHLGSPPSAQGNYLGVCTYVIAAFIAGNCWRQLHQRRFSSSGSLAILTATRRPRRGIPLIGLGLA
jgi:hypothetical protein